MIILNVYNLSKENVGKLYVDSRGMKVESSNTMLVNTIKKILKIGIDIFIGSDINKNNVLDYSKILYNVNENNFGMFENELIKFGYIVDEVKVREV